METVNGTGDAAWRRWERLLPGQPALGQELVARYAEPTRAAITTLGHLLDVLDARGRAGRRGRRHRGGPAGRLVPRRGVRRPRAPTTRSSRRGWPSACSRRTTSTTPPSPRSPGWSGSPRPTTRRTGDAQRRGALRRRPRDPRQRRQHATPPTSTRVRAEYAHVDDRTLRGRPGRGAAPAARRCPACSAPSTGSRTLGGAGPRQRRPRARPS